MMILSFVAQCEADTGHLMMILNFVTQCETYTN